MAAKTLGALQPEVGEPSFTTPSFIIDAVGKAVHDGHTGYGPDGGLVSLCELLVERLFKVYEIRPRLTKL